VRWHLVERTPRSYDFSSLDPMMEAARQQGMQVVWDLCHYGCPDDLDIFTPAFVDRFADFCRAVARHMRDGSDEVPLYTPINEISFFSWAAGEVGWFHPHERHRGNELKRQLTRACIAAIDAIRDVDPRARIITAEPLIHVVAPKGGPHLEAAAVAYSNSQFEAWDMLSGAMAPELGGHPKYLDVLGVNFYHDNQWEHPSGTRIPWNVHPRDSRWMPFHQLLRAVYERYRRPIFVAETSHVGVGRAEWLREITSELELAIDQGVAVEGACLYPIIDRFEWDNPSHWHNSGLWDFERGADGHYVRVINEPYAAQLRRSQWVMANRFRSEPVSRASVVAGRDSLQEAGSECAEAADQRRPQRRGRRLDPVFSPNGITSTLDDGGDQGLSR
jgi:beta-glucosidase/6-phospho-beta-glucosidase/beta-galactosidase